VGVAETDEWRDGLPDGLGHAPRREPGRVYGRIIRGPAPTGSRDPRRDDGPHRRPEATPRPGDGRPGDGRPGARTTRRTVDPADHGADDRRTAGSGCPRSRRRRIPRMRCVRADQPGSRRRPTSGCTPVRAQSATGLRNFGGRAPANVRTKARYALRVAVLRCPAREHPEPGYPLPTTDRPAVRNGWQ